MKRKKRLPILQNEFGFTPDTLNLIQEYTTDNERIVREQVEKARHLADLAQRPHCLQRKISVKIQQTPTSIGRGFLFLKSTGNSV